ncbi:MAG: flagellar basal body rod protein FlgC, partial [Maioricimonas sp. JB045]|uniref:flagellar basal body rod protein FlgC n=1 Tax=Maioricimonas sp. JC845 TaxID=3232138 RepID=UPI0034575625
MSFGQLLSTTDIAASGLAAERLRMEVVANNIANAHSTRTAEGGPYRRQQVIFSTALENAIGAGQPGLGGVNVVGIEQDMSPLQSIYDPGHPDAGPDGMVEMPNVRLPHEMVDLLTASRSYEANLKSLKMFRQMAEQALGLLRGLS